MDQRQNWVDYGKGIGILLVVYAHLLSIGYHTGLDIPERFFRLSDSIVYGFHMPFFFLLSGLFIEDSFHKRGIRDYLVDKFLRIGYPYLVWSIIQVSALNILFSNQLSRDTSLLYLLSILYLPWDQFWFLYALLLMHITYAVFTPFGRYAKIVLLIIALGLFFYPLQTPYMALPRFSAHFLFFICGMSLKDLFTSLESRAMPSCVISILAVFLVWAGMFIFENRIEPARLADDSHPLYFFVLSVLGIMTSALLAQYLARRNKLVFLKSLGRYSLQIFLVHMLAIVAVRIILIQGFGSQNWIIHMMAGMTTALAAPIILYRVGTRIGFPYLFEAPGILSDSR